MRWSVEGIHSRESATHHNMRQAAASSPGDRLTTQPAPPCSGGNAEGSPAKPLGITTPAPASPFVAIIDGRSLLRDCVSAFLASHFNMPVHSFCSIESLLAAPTRSLARLIIFATGLDPRRALLGSVARLCRECRSAPVLLLVDGCDYTSISEALQTGVRGILPTSLDGSSILEAIRLVQSGGTYIPQQMQNAAATPTQPCQVNGRTTRLTAREEQVLELLRAGQQNKQIAYSLGLSEGTVKVHLHNMAKKLGTRNRTQTLLASIA